MECEREGQMESHLDTKIDKLSKLIQGTLFDLS